MFGKRSKTVGNLRVGRALVRPDLASHVPGVREGNSSPHRKERGLEKMDGAGGKATQSRSTGIKPERREPISEEMPNLTPP